MRRLDESLDNNKLPSDAGIAIGPILFIIAVLGILAAAIAAGSGSFTTNTHGENTRTRATAMIDIGQNLKIGMDRVFGLGTDLVDVVIDPTVTSGNDSIFSPTGGGISPPSVTMAADPTSDEWAYPFIAVPGLGTASGSRVAVLRVTDVVCDEINSKVNAMAAGTASGASANIGDFTSTAVNDGSTWPTEFDGKPVGCVHNTNSASIAAGFYFYQVLAVE
jgi:hypothetical protein